MIGQSCCRRCNVEVHGHTVHLLVIHFLEAIDSEVELMVFVDVTLLLRCHRCISFLSVVVVVDAQCYCSMWKKML